jgi:hypothetical protein
MDLVQVDHDSSSDVLNSLVQSVFQRTWDEFYTWEQAYSQDTIDALARPSLPPPIDINLSEPLVFDTRSQNTAFGGGIDSFDVWDCSSPTTRQSTLSVESITCPQFKPHPPYEACTPCSRSILQGDDPDSMPFVPFADDPHFNQFDHMNYYSKLAWQPVLAKEELEECLDPDCELHPRSLTMYDRRNYLKGRSSYPRPYTSCALSITSLLHV